MGFAYCSATACCRGVRADCAESAPTMEIAMQNFKSKTAAFLFVLSAVAATSAHANYFHDPNTDIQLNVGSAPNPTPYDLRGIYPMVSRSMNEQGQVGLKILLSEKGTVQGAVVESSSGIPRLDDAAVKYVETYWSYEPPNGGEMPTEMPLTVNFVLR
jgi:TonB family protein